MTALIVTAVPTLWPTTKYAQNNLAERLDDLAVRVQTLEAKLGRTAAGAVAFLFCAFCVLWAQNTNRNPWLWFFVGLIFNVIAVLVLLAKNADDRRQARGEPAVAVTLVPIAIIAGILLLLALAATTFWSR